MNKRLLITAVVILGAALFLGQLVFGGRRTVTQTALTNVTWGQLKCIYADPPCYIPPPKKTDG